MFGSGGIAIGTRADDHLTPKRAGCLENAAYVNTRRDNVWCDPALR